MPYRSVLLPDTGEMFRIRISAEAMADWLKDRDWLRKQGRVDRPPDWDNGPLRSWFCHPGEEEHPWFRDQALSIAQAAADEEARGITSRFAVFTAVWEVGDRLMKLLVHGESDGAFEFRAKMENQSTGETPIDRSMRLPADTPIEVVGDTLDEQLSTFDLLTASLGGSDPTVNTYFDLQALFEDDDPENESPTALARKEVEAEFGPIPAGFSGGMSPRAAGQAVTDPVQ